MKKYNRIKRTRSRSRILNMDQQRVLYALDNLWVLKYNFGHKELIMKCIDLSKLNQ